jgi:penicillin-binding protein 2
VKRSARDIEESNRMIGRRTLLVGGVFFGTSAILAARMRYLQVERADDFRLLAEENRINVRLLPPERGLIFDRNGVFWRATSRTTASRWCARTPTTSMPCSRNWRGS